MRVKQSFLLAVVVAVATPAAHAFEGRWQLGAGAGIAKLARPHASLGPLLGVHAAYGVSDLFDARAALLAYDNGLMGHRVLTEAASVGLAYKMDVMQVIPYAGFSVGYYHRGGELRAPLSRSGPEFSVDLGADAFLSRYLGIGLELRYHGFVNDPLSSLADAPLFTLLLRTEYVWGKR